ncbi:hypothetical protein [Aequorivita capsosiphonis]
MNYKKCWIYEDEKELLRDSLYDLSERIRNCAAKI